MVSNLSARSVKANMPRVGKMTHFDSPIEGGLFILLSDFTEVTQVFCFWQLRSGKYNLQFRKTEEILFPAESKDSNTLHFVCFCEDTFLNYTQLKMN